MVSTSALNMNSLPSELSSDDDALAVVDDATADVDASVDAAVGELVEFPVRLHPSEIGTTCMEWLALPFAIMLCQSPLCTMMHL